MEMLSTKPASSSVQAGVNHDPFLPDFPEEGGMTIETASSTKTGNSHNWHLQANIFTKTEPFLPSPFTGREEWRVLIWGAGWVCISAFRLMCGNKTVWA